MKDLDQEIVDSADRWKRQEHEREMRRIELQHKRRSVFLEHTVGSEFAFWGVLFAALFFVFILVAIYIRPTTILDCSKADPERLERALKECNSMKGESGRRCYARTQEMLCEEKVVSDDKS